MPTGSKPSFSEPVPNLCRIIQIGDVHFPDHKDAGSAVDKKDSALRKVFSNAIGVSGFQQSLRSLIKVLQENKIDAVTFMGDLTTFGDLTGYQECVALFAKSLLSPGGELISPDKLVVVAGNHDVDRDLALSKGSPAKFEPLNKALSQKSIPEMTINELDDRKVTNSAGTVALFGINTCIGCGEARYISDSLVDGYRDPKDKSHVETFKQALKSAFLTFAKNSGKSIRGFEVLDAPALHGDALGKISEALEHIPFDELIVLVGHHNLLPQHVPRLAPYTEMVNSGALRRALTLSERPVLYLHGHIHTSDTERVSDPAKPHGEAICISAPAFEDGFNILEIAFDENKSPLGCRVIPYRMSTAGMLDKQSAIVIPFGGIPKRVMSAKQLAIMTFVTERYTCYIRDIFDELPNEDIWPDNREGVILQTIEELYWAGLIKRERVGSKIEEQRVSSVTQIV